MSKFGDRGIDTGRGTVADPVNVDDLYQFLEGTWQFERKVHDSILNQEGDCIGVAWFSADEPHNGQDTLAYREEGGLEMGEIKTAVDHEFRYAFPANSMAEVRFPDGRFYHVLDLTKGIVRVEHQCGDDTYHGIFRVLAPQAWLSVWRVMGPETSQVITTRYIRVNPN
ncbi:MAG: DUF6314 family protein [Magnetovibrio sp.]|nr:DUF6314 family protein [Magnetovibrio sp.]